MMMPRSCSLDEAIGEASKNGRFFCKFVSANDAGLTDSHQAGIYLSKESWPLFFGTSGERNENKEKIIKVHWEVGYPPVESCLKWYGSGTRSEYRITRFWANSPFDKKDCLGDLLILIPVNEEEVLAFLLKTEDNIEAFIDHFGISLIKNVAVYGINTEIRTKTALTEEQIIAQFTALFGGKFPPSFDMAQASRKINDKIRRINLGDPDRTLLKWVDAEYKLFKSLERIVYRERLQMLFGNVDELVKFSSSILNRRKSRAGRSFEHHIDYLLSDWGIPFSHPGEAEGNKKPDFIFPSNNAYADYHFDERLLTFLGAKTTCKDRWRQILNEANRIPVKHLITLQQGISENQMEEMQAENVVLVVPREYHQMYPPRFQGDLLDVTTFFQKLRSKY